MCRRARVLVGEDEDCALVLIDYQKEMFDVIRSETDADLVELNVRLLAKTAKALDMLIVRSTMGVGFGFNGPTLPSILSEHAGIQPIDCSSMNAFEDDAFREAVEQTGRKRLIIGGLQCSSPTRSVVDPRSRTAPGSRGSRTRRRADHCSRGQYRALP